MNTQPSGDLYKLVVDGDLGDGYTYFTVNLLEMLLLNDWLIQGSIFFVVLPLPDEEYELVVQAASRHTLYRKLGEIRELIGRSTE